MEEVIYKMCGEILVGIFLEEIEFLIKFVVKFEYNIMELYFYD